MAPSSQKKIGDAHDDNMCGRQLAALLSRQQATGKKNTEVVSKKKE
jgi:hypothetical protein